MPLHAGPAWREVKWSTSLDVQNHTLFPAVVIATALSQDFQGLGVLNITKVTCNTQIIGGNDGVPCEVAPPKFASDGNTTVQYSTFNPVDQDGDELFIDVNTPIAVSLIILPVQYNCEPAAKRLHAPD
jgi:hypothetical protein